MHLMTEVVLGGVSPMASALGWPDAGLCRSRRGNDAHRDAELLNAMAGGDERSLLEVFVLHHDCVRAVASKLYGPDQADRVTRDVFGALWTSPECVDNTDSDLCTLLVMAARAHGRARGTTAPHSVPVP